jgi:predicted DNA-binding protein
MIGLRLPKNAIARLDDWAKAMGCTRSELIRGLIEHGLSRRASATRWFLRNSTRGASK